MASESESTREPGFERIEDVERVLGHGSNPPVRTLYNIWERRRQVSLAPKAGREKDAEGTLAGKQIAWLQSDVSTVTAFMDQALEKEEFLLVCDAYHEALAYWSQIVPPSDLVKLHCHYATAQTRLGFARDVRYWLEPLVADADIGRRDRARILLQLGDIMREQAQSAWTKAARKYAAAEARKFYEQAIKIYKQAPREIDPDLLEARSSSAAMALVLGDPSAAVLGAEVFHSIQDQENTSGKTSSSTLQRAIALTVMGRIEEAKESYAELGRMENMTTSDLAEARYRSRLLAEALGPDPDIFKESFPPLQLIVFAGHLPDLPERPGRFPVESIPLVREMLRKKLDEMQARVGFVSAAAGADLLFIEALRERPGANYHLVLPWSEEEFLRTSVRPFEPVSSPLWEPMFRQAVRHAATVRELGQLSQPGDEMGWRYTQEVTAGLALQAARVSHLDVQPLCLWDERPIGGSGGTASFVEFWRECLDQGPITLKLPQGREPAASASCPSQHRAEQPSLHQEMKSILFADVVGYSKLPEKVIPGFIELFLRKLSQLIADTSHGPCHVNMWGDAVYAVFDFAEDAGRFALQLTQMIRDSETEWIDKGMFYEEQDKAEGKSVPRPLNIRVGLHTGPVFSHFNPVIRQLSFTGLHVSRTARIEPVVAPGEIYASEEFAAMAELGLWIAADLSGSRRTRSQDGEGFFCEYAGTLQLAKGYPGRHRTYRVVPRRVLVMEKLAMAAHALYCEEQRRLGATPENTPALRPWEELDEDLRDSNRGQIADFRQKLALLGYELDATGMSPSLIQITDEQCDQLSEKEHERWMEERKRQGWTYGPGRDNDKKIHPSLIPYVQLADKEKKKDRDVVRSIPKLIEKAGFRVRKIVK
jgi:class 3 adenylate cyclase/tetratricopeptide (TPR) repeat protein